MSAKKVRHPSANPNRSRPARGLQRAQPAATAMRTAVPNDAPVAFVIMPFSALSDLVFESLIRPAAAAAGFRVVRADTTLNQRAIMQDVVTGIQGADVVLADLTGRNANVFYELGLAHALKRPTILMAQDASEIPFDLAAYRAVIYSVEFGPGAELVSPMGAHLQPLLAAARANEIQFGSPFLDYAEPQPEIAEEPTEGILDILDLLVRVDVPRGIQAIQRIGELIQAGVIEQTAVLAELQTAGEPDIQLSLLVTAKLGAAWTRSADQLEPLVDEELVGVILSIEKGAHALIKGTRLASGGVDSATLLTSLDSLASQVGQLTPQLREASRMYHTYAEFASSLIRPGRRLAAIYARIATAVERLVALPASAREELGITA